MRSVTISILLMLGYFLLVNQLQKTIPQDQVFIPIIGVTVVYVVFVFMLWYRERNLYFNHIMNQKRIEDGNIEYILCPYCRSVQQKGTDTCTECKEEWILCGSCKVPFEQGSQVLIAPCCGIGFHYEHFEVILRETGHCPHCGSDLPLKTTNW